MSDLLDIQKSLKHSNLFLTGGAGVGKSYLTNEVIKSYRQEGKQVVALGSTGVSAVNIGGFTVHSFFVFGISNNFDELRLADRRAKSRLSNLKKILKATDLIIIDEISMISTTLLDMISYRLDSLGYLGKLLFVGDFFQLPPVQKSRKKDDLFVDLLYAFESSAWSKFDFTVVELTEMKRTQDKPFTHILHKVRRGIWYYSVGSISSNTISGSSCTLSYFLSDDIRPPRKPDVLDVLVFLFASVKSLSMYLERLFWLVNVIS